MAGKTLAEIAFKTKTLIAGLRAHGDIRGVDEAHINELEQKLNMVNSTDSEQEALKAAQKTKTAELKNLVKELKTMHLHSTQLVKMSVPQEGWKEFGIDASR